MAEKPKINLFEAAMRGVRVLKQGDIVCLIADGGGAMITFTLDYISAQKWAQRKPETGNRVSDRGRFLEQLPTVVARPGSFISTRGSDKVVEKLAKAMIQAGYDLGEWSLTPEMKALAKPKHTEPALKKPAPAEGKEGAGTEEAPQDAPPE